MTSNEAFAPRPPVSAMAGCFSLPALDQTIPVVCGGHARQQLLARFAEASALAGVALPSGTNFHSIEQVVTAQWSQYLERRFAGVPMLALAGCPSIQASDDAISFVINSEERLNVHRLKPVIEQLESEKEGLGWFVHAALTSATSHGHALYTMDILETLMTSYAYDMEAVNDEQYARLLLSEEGRELADGETVTQEVIDGLKKHYFFWPSDLVEAAGGHKHLLGGMFTFKSRDRPKVLGAGAARRFAKQAHPLSKSGHIVQLALKLQGALSRDKDRDFVWYQSQTDDDASPVGAAAIIAWDDVDILLEAVSHFEQQEQQGECEFAYARLCVPAQEADLVRLVQAARAAVAYFDRWALLAQLLSHFPTWEQQ